MERMEARGWDAGHDGTSCREGGRLWARLQRVDSGLACWPATGQLVTYVASLDFQQGGG